MDRTAQVNSLEAIDRFRGALALFGEEVGQVLSAIRTDLQRFQHWLEQEQLKYWQQQIRVREERLNEAKGDLHRCLAATIDPNRTPSCLQEKKLVAQAKQRLEEAERKLAAVRHWIVVVRQAITDYHARSEQLASAVAADVPRGISELLRTVERLNAYLELSVTSAEESPGMSHETTKDAAASPPAEQPRDKSDPDEHAPESTPAAEPSENDPATETPAP